MFDTGLFASQGRDRDGESAGKEKKGWRAHELRKNEFKITLADVKIGRAIGRGAYGVVCEGTYKGFPVAVFKCRESWISDFMNLNNSERLSDRCFEKSEILILEFWDSEKQSEQLSKAVFKNRES